MHPQRSRQPNTVRGVISWTITRGVERSSDGLGAEDSVPLVKTTCHSICYTEVGMPTLRIISTAKSPGAQRHVAILNIGASYDTDDESESDSFDSDSSSIAFSAPASRTCTYNGNGNVTGIGEPPHEHEPTDAAEPRSFSNWLGITDDLDVEEFPDGIAERSHGPGPDGVLDLQFGDDVEVWLDGLANGMEYPNVEDDFGNGTCVDGGLGDGHDGDSNDASAQSAKVQMTYGQVLDEAPVKESNGKLDAKSDSSAPTASNESEEGELDERREVTVAEEVSDQPKHSAPGMDVRYRRESAAGNPLVAGAQGIAKTPTGVAPTVTKENDLSTNVSVFTPPPAKRRIFILQDHPQGAPLLPSNTCETHFPRFNKNKDTSSSHPVVGVAKANSKANAQYASEGVKIENEKAPTNSSVKKGS
ncbi:hypothetical protein Moror_4141 [Moniliophthora roreri MCA 2997]|uniref:Uncharacterized protein n=1 Tax=Moniliophthora roreri (strain MCA 2997) TaxID=1381753 RepID=V2XAC6_MONRO|nr:hypothetical protein Moror_4141 [Moniliophthora roreri MCA 2997]